MNEPIVVDVDPPEKTGGKPQPVVLELPDVPPRAQSNGWGDMSWSKR